MMGWRKVGPCELTIISILLSLQTAYAQRSVLFSIAHNPNDPTRSAGKAVVQTLESNVSSLRTSGYAFAVRINAIVDNELSDPPLHDTLEANMNTTYNNADYMLWGDPAKGGSSNGAADVRSDAEWDGDPRHATFPNNYVNFKDVCGSHGAFIGIRNSQIRCIGDADTCKGVDKIGNSAVAKTKVFCTNQAMTAIELLTKYPADATGSVVKIIGAPTYTALPTDATFLTKWRAIERNMVVDAKATPTAAAILLNDRTVLSWKDAKPFLPSDGKYVRFASSLLSNSIGFVVQLDTGKVSCWGDGVDETNIPSEITEAGSEIVADIFTSNECFGAITQKGRVYTWGLGELSYCHKSGGRGAEFTPFSSVESALSSGVTRVVGNKKAFAAVKSNGDVVVWGHKNFGGELPSGASNELKWGLPETLVATDNAFTVTRRDGRTISWGDALSSYVGVVAKGLANGSTHIASSSYDFALITKTKNLVIWTGADQGIYSINPDDKTANFHLPLTPQRLQSCPMGIAVVLGRDCTYGKWTEFSACDRPCGQGMQTRTRAITAFAINGSCSYHTEERRICNTEPCNADDEAKSTVISTKFIVAFSVAGGVGVLLLLGGLYLYCSRKRAADDYGWSDEGQYGGYDGYGGGGGWGY